MVTLALVEVEQKNLQADVSVTESDEDELQASVMSPPYCELACWQSPTPEEPAAICSLGPTKPVCPPTVAWT
jgi:hypothetical protein